MAEVTARLMSEYDIPRSADWIGGLSGIVMDKNGLDFHVISDWGTLARGSLTRQGGVITGATFDAVQPILNRFGVAHARPFADAEGLALADDGRIFISFETQDRVSVYQDFTAQERLAGVTNAWNILPENKGIEALARASDGSLWALPEHTWRDGAEARLYHRPENGAWTLFDTIPIGERLNVVGADFGPDGRLYLLERGFFAVGFFTRVRRLTFTDHQRAEIATIETLLQTVPGRHGNLEGLSVWEDDAGFIRLTMVSDDNFKALQRNQLVEYRLEDGLAEREP